MDEQAQKQIIEVEHRFKHGWIDDDDHYEHDVHFLLHLVHQQEAQLAKCERVVEAARHWRDTRKGDAWSIESGAGEIVDMLQVAMAREQALIIAVDASSDGDE